MQKYKTLVTVIQMNTYKVLNNKIYNANKLTL